MNDLKWKKLALLFSSENKREGIKWTLNLFFASFSQRISFYSNLCYNINKHLKDLIEELALSSRKRPLHITFLTYLKKTQSVHAWMEFILLALQLFSFVDNNFIRRHFKQNPISVETLMKYISKLTTYVEEKVYKVFPDHFSVIFNRFSGGDTHYFSVFASFSIKHPS